MIHSNLFVKQVIFVSVLSKKPCNIPLEERCPITRSEPYILGWYSIMAKGTLRA
jgi:hypothetical protein